MYINYEFVCIIKGECFDVRAMFIYQECESERKNEEQITRERASKVSETERKT